MSDKTTKEIEQECLESIKKCNLAASGKTVDESFEWFMDQVLGDKGQQEKVK